MQKDTKWDVVVIGGGPAGMMAAGRAAERGKSVLLLEKNVTLGKKLLITGGGRCNVTNNKPDVRTMLAKYKNNDKFLFSAFAQFGVSEALNFFHDHGLVTKEEAEGRIFPASNQAQSVWNVLANYIKRGGVKVETKAKVAGIHYNKPEEQMVITLAGGFKLRARSCVVACGGTSRPETGSTGEGFLWLKRLGHTIVENNMALVPIRLKDSWVKKAAGVALKNIKLTTFLNGVKQKAYKGLPASAGGPAQVGKLLFTHVGISGPTVLNMSREVGELLQDEEEVVIMLDLFPSIDGGALRQKLQTLLIDQSNKKIKNVFSSLIAPALVDSLLALAKIDGDTPNHSVRTEDRKALVSLLKAVPLHVAGLLGKDKAVVSSGGVGLDQINFKTMQSRIVPPLYVVGDMLNVDRPSGGYSLQLCWTTGYVAGDNC